MRLAFRHILLANILGSSLLVGCASQGSAASAAARSQHAVYCPKCETTWVMEPVSHGTKATAMHRKGKMVCPDCDTMAKDTLLSNGKVQLHNCPTCQVTPEILVPGIETQPGLKP